MLPTLRQYATTAITSLHAVPNMFVMGAMLGRPADQLKMPRPDAYEADARRQHQALLRAADRDVDAPFVMPIVGAGQARDRVDRQQCRVTGGIDGAAHRGDVGGDAGGGLVVDHAHRLDALAAVVTQALDQLGLHAVAPTARQPGLVAARQGQELVPFPARQPETP